MSDTFTFDDLVDIHELMDCRAENEWRMNEWAEAQRRKADR